jgi:hypothetical protein
MLLLQITTKLKTTTWIHLNLNTSRNPETSAVAPIMDIQMVHMIEQGIVQFKTVGEPRLLARPSINDTPRNRLLILALARRRNSYLP